MNGSIPIGASHIRGKVHASGARIVGRISSPARIRGKLSMPQFVGGDYYKGNYIITPKTTEQIMATKAPTDEMKRMEAEAQKAIESFQ